MGQAERERPAVRSKLSAVAQRHGHALCMGLLGLAFLVPRVPLLSRPLYGDELQTFIQMVTGKSFAGIVWGDFVSNNHVLNSLVMKALYVCTGDVPAILRLPHLLCALLAVLLLFQTASAMIGRPAGLVAALLASLHPAIMLYSVWGRGYALMLLFTLLSCRLFLGVVESPSRKGLASYFVVSSLATISHLFSLLVILAQASFLLLTIVGARKPSAGSWRTRSGALVPLALCQLGVFAFAMAMSYPTFVAAPSTNPFPFHGEFPIALLNFLNGFEYWPRPDVLSCLTALVALAGIPALRRWPDARLLIALVFATPIAMYVLSLALPTYLLYPRFFIFLVPWYCLLFAAGLHEIGRLVLSRLAGSMAQRRALGAVGLACALPVAVSFSSKTNIRDMQDVTRVQESITALLERNPEAALFTNNENYVVVRLRQNAHEDRVLTATSASEVDRLLSESLAPSALFIHIRVRPLREASAVRYNRAIAPEERLHQDQLLLRHLTSMAEDEFDFSPYATVFALKTARGRSAATLKANPTVPSPPH